VNFEVETRRRRHTIEIRRSGDGWAVTVDGRAMRVDVARADSRWSMLVRPSPADAGGELHSTGQPASSYEIAIEPRGQGTRIVHVNGHAVPVTLLAPERRRSTASGAAIAAGPAAIVAPMPGRIVKVLVEPGEAVAAGQGLVVVEAMKMENELRAPRAGTVSDVRVREGAPVEANVVLVVIT
jgi:biotin carboxyl carrier protein